MSSDGLDIDILRRHTLLAELSSLGQELEDRSRRIAERWQLLQVLIQDPWHDES